MSVELDSRSGVLSRVSLCWTAHTENERRTVASLSTVTSYSGASPTRSLQLSLVAAIVSEMPSEDDGAVSRSGSQIIAKPGHRKQQRVVGVRGGQYLNSTAKVSIAALMVHFWPRKVKTWSVGLISGHMGSRIM